MTEPTNAEMRAWYDSASEKAKLKFQWVDILLLRLEAVTSMAIDWKLEFYSGEHADGCADTKTRLRCADDVLMAVSGQISSIPHPDGRT